MENKSGVLNETLVDENTGAAPETLIFEEITETPDNGDLVLQIKDKKYLLSRKRETFNSLLLNQQIEE